MCNKLLDIVYYNQTELLGNQAIYYPSHKENDDKLDRCYLQQVKADLYSQEGIKVGVFLALNNYRSDDNHGINTGNVTIKTDKGILSWINAYDVGSSLDPFLKTEPIITKAIYVKGDYLSNGLDVYIKIIRFNDPNLTRKIEILY